MKHYIYIICLCLASIGLSGCEENEQEAYERYINRGDAYFEDGDYIRARLEYKNAARITPSDPRSLLKLGKVEEARGNLQQALSYYIAAEQQQSDFIPVIVKLAEFYLTAGQAQEVWPRIESLLKIKPNYAQAHALRGSLNLRERDLESAHKDATFALEQDPDNIVAFSVLTGIDMVREDYERALDTLERAIEKRPDEVSFLLLKATIFSEQGDIASLERTYRDLFALKPANIRYRFDLARILEESGHQDDAEQLYRETASLFSEMPEAKHRLIRFLERRKGPEAAEQALMALIDQAETDQREGRKRPYLWLADLYIRNGQPDRAIETLQRINATNPDDALGLNASATLADITLKQGDIAFTDQLVRKVLEADVNNPHGLLLRAKLSYIRGDSEKAVADLRAVLSDHPGFIEATRLLSEIFTSQGRYDLAADTLMRAVERNPSELGLQVRLAQLFALRGNHDNAFDILEDVNEADPSYAVAWEALARIAITHKDWPTARRAISTLADLDGQAHVVLFLRARLAVRTGEKAKGKAMFFEIIENNPETALATSALRELVELAKSPSDLEAIAAFIRGIDAPDATLLTVLGQIEASQNDAEPAIIAFRKAINLGPDNPAPFIGLSDILQAQGSRREAMAILREAEDAFPNALQPPMKRATMLHKAGETDDAMVAYEEVLARFPEADAAANNLAHLIADHQAEDKKELNQARILAERFANSENPAYLDTLGWVYLRMERPDLAKPALDKAIRLLDEQDITPQIAYHYGLLLVQLERGQEALPYLKRAIAEDNPFPGRDHAVELLDRLDAGEDG